MTRRVLSATIEDERACGLALAAMAVALATAISRMTRPAPKRRIRPDRRLTIRSSWGSGVLADGRWIGPSRRRSR